MSKHILLCEDEAPILRALEIKFKRAGYSVVCAAHGEEAWQAIEKRVPDILVTDCLMPVLDGYELAARARANEATAQLPIVFITAAAEIRKTLDVAENLNVLEVVAKPFSPKEVVSLVERIISDSGPKHEVRRRVQSNRFRVCVNGGDDLGLAGICEHFVNRIQAPDNLSEEEQLEYAFSHFKKSVSDALSELTVERIQRL